MLQIKVVQNSISFKKLIARLSVSPPGVDLGGPKIMIFEIIYIKLQDLKSVIG